MLPLGGPAPRAPAWRSHPRLGRSPSLLPSTSPWSDASPPVDASTLALFTHDPAGCDGGHLCLVDFPLLLCRSPCRGHLSCLCRPFPGPLDIPMAWGETALQPARCGWLQASHGSAGAFTGCCWRRFPSTSSTSSSSPTRTASPACDGRRAAVIAKSSNFVSRKKSDLML